MNDERVPVARRCRDATYRATGIILPPTAAAVATATAAATATATAAAVAAAAAAAAAATVLLRLGLVDRERTTVDLLAVHLLDGVARLGVRRELDETEAARAAGVAIGND